MPSILFPHFSAFFPLPPTLPIKIPAELGSSAYQRLLEGEVFGRAVRISTDFQWWLDFCAQISGDPVGMQLTVHPKNQKAIPFH